MVDVASTSDVIDGIIAPYLPDLAVWGRDGTTYRQGDQVPSLGMAETYAVLLDAPDEAPARYLWVQRGKITNLMAHQPIEGSSVFDVRGRYLGRGGETLEDVAKNPEDPFRGWISDIVKRAHEGNADAEGPARTHQFYLRPDFVVSVELPVDMTTAEARRLADFVLCLPFPRRP